ncbi:uncharacterized protein LOC131531392 isoform X2 [Onychostoma macrolepis]|uniref:Immunoglobulin subtype domain-containing protein n=1 Tax=Onychostoma macrolepis TaxID=369639 RepID=A0A7J6BUD8_9TELE|nr:uncharacterized protein LOC131531392 isoform X2 [Onychostoma macrolepis]KAF4097262.1 hypothetical protein G5714_021270 [Onychostoma macrolepis]
MMRSNVVLILFAVFVDGVFGDTEAVKSVSVMEGDPVTLYTNVTKGHHDIMRWYFEDTRIALINGHPNTSCVYDGESGRFRDRLKVDYKTGSLNITDIRAEHAGRYEAEIIRSESSGKSESFNRPRKCDGTKINKKNSDSKDIIKRFSLAVSAVPGSGLSPGVVAGIVGVGVVLLMAAAVVVGRRKIGRSIFRNVKEKPTSERQVSNDETQNEKSPMI